MMFQTFDIKDAEYWVIKCNDIVLGGGVFYPIQGFPKGYVELSKFHFKPELTPESINFDFGKFLPDKYNIHISPFGIVFSKIRTMIESISNQ